MGTLNGKVGLVTGAAGRLGREYASLLAREGCNLVLCDRRDEVRDIASHVAVGDLQARPEVVDVSRPEDVRSVVDRAMRAFGRIDVLINSAEAAAQTLPIDDLDKSLSDYARVIGTNLKAVFMLGRAVMPHMIAQRSGHIINVISDRVHSPPGRRTGGEAQDLFDAAHWGVIGLTISWAKELREHQIRVNSFCVGLVSEVQQVCDLALQLIAEGPGGRTGESIGVWPGFAIELAPVPRPMAGRPATRA